MQPAPAIPTQQHSVPPEGLALIWDPVPGAIRYAFIVGVVGAPVPPLPALISGQAPGFALLGIPAHFTGAALIGSSAGEERQFGLVAYMADGRGVPVANLQFMPARRAPRDRQYHPLMPPTLQAGPRSGPLSPSINSPAGQPEQRPSPLAPLRGGDPREAAPRFGAGTASIPPHTTPGSGNDQAGQGGGAELPMQQFRIGRDGLSVTWDAVPGAMRYGLVVGVAGVQPPALETIMRGGSAQFSVLGIPARFTGTTLMGPAQEEERQFCLIAWRSDGSMTPVQSARLGSMRSAPRDRDYHALTSPALTSPSGMAMPPASSAPGVYAAPPQMTPQRRQTAEEAFAAMMAARQSGLPAPPPPTPAVQQTPPPTSSDPWDLLTSPVPEPEPARWIPAPAQPEPVQQPEPRVAEPVKAADPWDLLGPPSAEGSEEEQEEEQEEPAPTSTLSLPDPWDVLEEAVHTGAHAARHDVPELPTWLPAEPVVAEPLEPAAEIEDVPAIKIAPEPERTSAAEKLPEVPPARDGEDAAKAAAEPLPAEPLPPPAGFGTPSPPIEVRHEAAASVEFATSPAPAQPLPEPVKAEAVRLEAEIADVEVTEAAEKTPAVAMQPIADKEESVLPAPLLEAEPAAMERPAHLPAVAADRDLAPEEQVAPRHEAEQPAAIVESAAPAAEPRPLPDSAPKEPETAEVSAEVIRADAVPPLVATGDALPAAPPAEATPAPAPDRGVEFEPRPAQQPIAALPEQPVTAPESGAGSAEEARPIEVESQAAQSDIVPAEPAPIRGEQPAPPAVEPVPVTPEEVAPPEQKVQDTQLAGTIRTHLETVEDVVPVPEDAAPAPLGALTPAAQQIEPLTPAPSGLRESEPEIDEPAHAEPPAAQPPLTLEPPEAARPTEASAPLEVAAPIPETLSLDVRPTEQAAPVQAEAETAEEDHPPAQPPAVPTPPVEVHFSPATEADQTALATSGTDARPSHLAAQEEAVSAAVSASPTLLAGPPSPPAIEDQEVAPRAPAEPALETHSSAWSADVKDSAESRVEEQIAAPPTATPVLQDDLRQMPALEAVDDGGPLPPVERKEEAAAPETAAVPSPVQEPTATVTSYDVWLVEEPISPPVPEPPPSTSPQQAAGPARAAAPSTGPLPAALVALLEEAELYLLPQWADYAEVARLLDRVEQEAPNHVRVLELRERLRDAQQGEGIQDVTPLLREAEECLARNDFWEAVDLYEQALAKQPENADARSGVERARMLARWSAQWTGATGDAVRLQTLGDEYAAVAPELAHQAYAAAFAATPTVAALHGLLVSLLRGSRGAAVASTARDGLKALRATGRLAADDEQDSALENLARCGEPGLPEAEAERMIAAFSRLLAGDIA